MKMKTAAWQFFRMPPQPLGLCGVNPDSCGATVDGRNDSHVAERKYGLPYWTASKSPTSRSVLVLEISWACLRGQALDGGTEEMNCERGPESGLGEKGALLQPSRIKPMCTGCTDQTNHPGVAAVEDGELQWEKFWLIKNSWGASCEKRDISEVGKDVAAKKTFRHGPRSFP
nr:ervatamin-B-like [Ipomoea batatas]